MSYKPKFLFIYQEDIELENYLTYNLPFKKESIINKYFDKVDGCIEYEHYSLKLRKVDINKGLSLLNLKGHRVSKVTLTKSVYDKILDSGEDLIQDLFEPMCNILGSVGSNTIEIFNMENYWSSL